MLDATAFRGFLDEMHMSHPELFPQAMAKGYTLHDILPLSHKLPDIRLRRFKLKANQEVYTLRPSFVLPYMTGYTDDVEHGLFLLRQRYIRSSVIRRGKSRIYFATKLRRLLTWTITVNISRFRRRLFSLENRHLTGYSRVTVI